MIEDDGRGEPEERFAITLEFIGEPPLATDRSRLVINEERGTQEFVILQNGSSGEQQTDATVSIDDIDTDEADGTATFTVRLSEALDSDETLDVEVIPGTATGADLGPEGDWPTTVTIPADETSATIEVPLIDDDIVEVLEETFTVRISENPDNPLRAGVRITDGTAMGTITDDDMTTVSIANIEVAEDVPGGNAVFTVSLSRMASRDVVLDVDFTTPGTPGTADAADLGPGALPPTVTIPAGAEEAMINVPIVDDTIAEGAETFTVTISENAASPLPVGVTFAGGAAMATATGTIGASDGNEPLVSIADAAAVAENADGSASFGIRLDREVDRDVVLAVAYAAGSATLDDLGSDREDTVTIPAGATEATLDVPIVDDAIAEGDETFTVTITTDTVGIGIAAGTAMGTITDDDRALVSLSSETLTASEGGMFTWTVSLDAASDEQFSITWTAIAAGDTATADDLDRTTAMVTFPANSTAAQTFTITAMEDTVAEGDETFTVTIAAATSLPAGVMIDEDSASLTATIAGDTPEESVLIGSRRIGAGAALRRHAGRFDSMTGMVVRHRLDGHGMRHLSGSENLGSGAAAAGGALGGTGWGAWIDGAWAGIGGAASGRQADVHGGVDYLDDDAGWLVGVLIGYEHADLDIGDATFESAYTHFGVYGGARLSERLRLDGAATYGTATPDVADGGVSASYDANRFTARGALTGDFGFGHGLEDGSSVKVEPQLGLLYSRETLGAFTDSDGGIAGRETLELGRFSAGPLLTWGFDGGRVVGGARVQWDFLELEDGAGGQVSGAANVGVRLDVAPGVSLDVQGDVDGIGVTEDFRSVGGRIDLGVRF